MFEALGYLDSAQSLAAWRSTLPNWCVPTFTAARKAIRVEQLEHPLLADAVPNSVELDGQSLLITGSNMSGKTTFVRTLGVNAVLAQTLYTVCATSWRAPMLGVRTSIGRADSLVEGKSYYLAEVESVLALVRAKDDARQHLFLLDEVFRGTNTTERVAAACAVLSHLNQGDDLVVAATHDLELLGLLSGDFAMHHFREQVVERLAGFRLSDSAGSLVDTQCDRAADDDELSGRVGGQGARDHRWPRHSVTRLFVWQLFVDRCQVTAFCLSFLSPLPVDVHLPRRRRSDRLLFFRPTVSVTGPSNGSRATTRMLAPGTIPRFCI